MNQEYPLVSVIMATYNRAKSIERAINSVLVQSYTNFELIIVNDGSDDNTSEILKRYNDPRIRIFVHDQNKGVTAAKNTGLRNIRGEWFTTFDSDDEMIPDAIETMINIPLYFDTSITAVTSNCLDTTKNDYAGKGLMKDQYLDVETIMTKCSGDFWGLTKTSLLKDDCFVESMNGLESLLWYKIDDRAKRYYIHKQLIIVHTEGKDRISTASYNFKRELKMYTNLISEEHYLNKIKKYRPVEFNKLCRTGLLVTSVSHDKSIASRYYEFLKNDNRQFLNKLILNYWFVAVIMIKFEIIKIYIKPFLKKL